MLDQLRTRLRLSRATQVGRNVTLRGRVWIHGRGKVRIEDNVVLDGEFAPIELHSIQPESELVLRDGAYIGPGTSIEAEKRIDIGRCSSLGPFCKLMDTHFHHALGGRQVRPPAQPLTIEENVVVGARCVLISGAHLEGRVTIAPGTVVTRRVAAGRKAAGVPARIS